MATELVFLHDAHLTSFPAAATAADVERCTLDPTVSYPSRGREPHGGVVA